MRKYRSAFTDSSHAYAGAAASTPVVVSIVFALDRMACTANQFPSVPLVEFSEPSNVQFTPANVPAQWIIRFENRSVFTTTVLVALVTLPTVAA